MFRGVKLTKNVDPDKYPYSGCNMGFHSCSLFSYLGFDWDKNVVIFGVDSSSSVHIDKKEKDLLVLGEGATPGLGYTMITAEAKYSINFSRFKSVV